MAVRRKIARVGFDKVVTLILHMAARGVEALFMAVLVEMGMEVSCPGVGLDCELGCDGGERILHDKKMMCRRGGVNCGLARHWHVSF